VRQRRNAIVRAIAESSATTSPSRNRPPRSSSDARQPRCPPPGQEPEHGGVEVIVEPQRRRSHRGDDHDSQDDNHERQPCPGTHRHRARQWRRRAGRAAPGRRSPHGGPAKDWPKRPARSPSCLVAHRTAPPSGPAPAPAASSRPRAAGEPTQLHLGVQGAQRRGRKTRRHRVQHATNRGP